jgi:Tol biopolymer transport system component
VLSLLARESEFGRVCDEDDEEVCEVAPWVVAGEYVRQSGVSMGTAHVSGVAALVRSRNPHFSRLQVRQALLGGAEDLGEAGWDMDFGYGRVNARRAVAPEQIGVAEILSPENRGKVWDRDFPYAVMGTADAPAGRLRQWRLSVRREGRRHEREVARGTEPVINGVLGELRLGKVMGLRRGHRHTLKLEVEDTDGNLATDTKVFLISDPRYAVIPLPDRFFEGGQDLTLSADGTRVSLARADRDGGDASIWLYDSVLRELRRVGNGSLPFLAPGGSWLVYGGRLPEQSELVGTILYDVDARNYRLLPSRVAAAGPLDAEGKRMIFSSRLNLTGDNPDDNLQVFFFDLPAGPMRRILRIPRGVPGVDALNDLAFSHDGTRAAFLSAANLDPAFSTNGYQQVFVYDDATRVTTQLSGRPNDPSIAVERLTSSADAGTLAYLVGNDVFVVDTASGRSENEVGVNSSFHPPVLSGDGGWLAFTSSEDFDPRVGNEDLRTEVFLLNLRTRDVQQVTDTLDLGAGTTALAVSSAGDRLVVDTGGSSLNPPTVHPSLNRVVFRAPGGNHSPTLFLPNVLVVQEGNRSITTLQAMDADNDPLTFHVERIPHDRIDAPRSRLRDLARSELLDRGDGTADLVFTPRQNEAGQYPLRVAVFDEAGNFDVRDVTLVIEDTQPEGDADCDGRLTRKDIEALIGALFDPQWRSRCITADTNDDGRVVVNDLIGLILRLTQ